MNLLLSEDYKFTPVSLSEIDRGWLGKRRFDRKFLITENQFRDFLTRQTKDFAILNINDMTSFQYRTEYFDTDSLDCYHDHLQRKSRRAKIRLRTYLDSGQSRIEVKVRLGNVQSIKFAQENAVNYDSPQQEFVRAVLLEHLPNSNLAEKATQLRSTALNTYQRSTLLHRNQSERITVDSSLVLQAFGTEYSTKAGLLLLEVKSLNRRAETVRNLLLSGVRPIRFSKYCASIDLSAVDRPRVHRRKFLTNSFEERLP